MGHGERVGGGMTFTIELGIYIVGEIGVCFEDLLSAPRRTASPSCSWALH